MRKPLIAGNWKMFKTTAEAVEFARSFLKLYEKAEAEAAICAPFTQLAALKEALGKSGVKLGAQNMHFEEQGAFTGEISPSMLAEIGVDYCIIGHSERRQYFAETDETVNRKLHKAFEHGIVPILCVGEVLDQRDGGEALNVVKRQTEEAVKGLSPEQVKRLVVAYEPVWAIGTGRTASPEQANEMCGHIRSVLAGLYGEDISKEVVIQYGGSVKPENAAELMNMDEIDGALVGGASLKPEDFIRIIACS